jgi:hypothetical protein
MSGFPIFGVAIGVAALLDFGIAFGLYLYLGRMARKCNEVRRKWPQVQGKILSSQVAEKRGKEGTLYSPEIRFEYAVQDKRYESDRCTLYPRWWSSDRTPHLRFVARFPLDREVMLWVNPQDPADAVLSTEATGGGLRLVMFLLLAAGVMTTIMGVCLAIFRPSGTA